MATYEQQFNANPQLQEGFDFWHRGDSSDAEKSFAAMVAVAQENDDLSAASIGTLYLGFIDLENAKFEAAQSKFQATVRRFPIENMAVETATALAGLGRAYEALANVAEARGAYLESLHISVAKKAKSALLFVLPGIALRLAKEASQAPLVEPKTAVSLRWAIALYTMVTQQVGNGEPAHLNWFEAVYGRQIEDTAYALAADIVPIAKEEGQRLDLWPTAVSLIATLEKLGWVRETSNFFDEKMIDSAESLAMPPLTLPLAGEERRKQLVLLDKVQTAWVKGVLEPLEQSNQNAELIALRRLRLDTAVTTPWANIIETDRVDDPVPPEESMLELFLKADRALLILGEPGGGKTTTLIQLARSLIAQSRERADQPIPVVMNLSTWAEARGNLADWIVEELTAKYQIPRQLGREWLDNNQLLLLLDGLDEMPLEAQPKCIAAINSFRQEHGLVGLVVCCRRGDYQAHQVRLNLGGAILIQPLSRHQIETYLRQAGFQTAVLAELLAQDKALWELTESPLMLSMLRQAFSQEESDLTHLLKDAIKNPKGDVTSRRHRFFDTFVERMFKRRGVSAALSPKDTKETLAWLSQSMVEHNQTIFLIEQMQPSWFSDRKRRWVYLLISRAIVGLAVGILIWLSVLLGRRAGLDLSGGIYSQVASWWQLSMMVGAFLVLIPLNLLWGILIGMVDAFIYDRFDRRHGKSGAAPGDRRRHRFYLLTIGTMVGVPTGIIFALFEQPLFALFSGIFTASFFMIEGGYSRQGLSYREDIQTVEALNWSGKDAIRSLLQYGLPSSILFGILGSFLWRDFGLAMALIFGFFFFLIGGMRRTRLESSSQPNQGILLSLRNSLMAAAVFGLLNGLLFMFLFDVATGIAAFFLMGLVAWFLYGGAVVLKHSGLRLMLWQNGRLPLNLHPFFNHVSDLIFMRRVGGGYMFTHRLLQEYFAGLPLSGGVETAVSDTKAKIDSESSGVSESDFQSVPASSERYILESVIGTGTMGKVYRGKDSLTGQTVAIKQLRPYLTDEYPEAVNRFIREGEALQQLNHPNILPVLDVISEEQNYLIVTEYFPGSLRDLLTEQSQISVQQTVAIGLELADALARAHHLNIIHRDVKPENILLAADGTPRLADFGVAHLGQHTTRLTEEGGFMGTPSYLSPEICIGEPASPRSDIWALGILLYEMLAGRLPFSKQQVMATLLTIVNDPIPDIAQFRPDVPAALIFLMDDMLEKDPAQRINRMRLVAAELERIQEDLQDSL